MQKGDIVYFKGREEYRVIQVLEDYVVIRRGEGALKQQMKVRKENVRTTQSARYKQEMEQLHQELAHQQKILWSAKDGI